MISFCQIYNKGGFLRSDKLFGHADISLADLEQKTLINGRFDILDGRKKTGGYIHVEVSVYLFQRIFRTELITL
jgi:hypothetical protein